MRSLRPAGRVVSSEPEGVGEGRGVWERVLTGRVEEDRGAGPGGGSPSVPAGLEPVAMTALRVPRRLCWLVLDERSCTRLGARAARGLPEIPSCTLYAPQPLGHLGLSGTWTSKPSTRTTSGLSLHEAASMGHPDCVRYLLARGPPSTAWKADW